MLISDFLCAIVVSGFVSPLTEKVELRENIKQRKKCGNMEYETNKWIWDGMYNHPHVFGGLMLTAALLGLSTSYFGGITVPQLPYLWPDSGIFHKKKCEKKRIRVYMDGCFDLMHYGHANALRQAKALGDELVVGVVSDEEIIANKGPPVLSMEERLVFMHININDNTLILKNTCLYWNAKTFLCEFELDLLLLIY